MISRASRRPRPLISTTTMNGGWKSVKVANAEADKIAATKAPDAEEGDVAEVEQAGQADHDVQAHRGGREDHHLGGDRHVGVGAVLGEREHEGHDEGRQDQHPLVPLGDPGRANPSRRCRNSTATKAPRKA